MFDFFKNLFPTRDKVIVSENSDSNFKLELNFLHWNVKGMKGADMKNGLQDLIYVKKPDVIIISESHDRVEKIMLSLGYFRINFHKRQYGSVTKFIEIYSVQQQVTLTPVKDFDSIVCTAFEYSGQTYLVHGVHFSSKRSKGSNYDTHRIAMLEYRLNIKKVEDDIHKLRSNQKVPLSIIVGDFNCNPFENAMTAIDGFHALDLSNNYPNKLNSHHFYLNPSLLPMGGLNGSAGNHLPVGTYYFGNKNLKNASQKFWNMYDGVIISPGLKKNYLSGSNLNIISSINNSNKTHAFYNSANDTINHSDYSDHLPITFNLKF